MTCLHQRFMRVSRTGRPASPPPLSSGQQNSTTEQATHLTTISLSKQPVDWLGLDDNSGAILFQQKLNGTTFWIFWIADEIDASSAHQNRHLSSAAPEFFLESLTPQRTFTGSLLQI